MSTFWVTYFSVGLVFMVTVFSFFEVKKAVRARHLMVAVPFMIAFWPISMVILVSAWYLEVKHQARRAMKVERKTFEQMVKENEGRN